MNKHNHVPDNETQQTEGLNTQRTIDYNRTGIELINNQGN